MSTRQLSSVFHGKTVLGMAIIMMLIINVTMVNVALASSDTHLYVDPPEVLNVMPGDYFLVNIWVTEAPSTYDWEFYISWDRDLLELLYIGEGDFLDRGIYNTTFLFYPSIPQANDEGEIMIGCSLQGGVPWASGDGQLCVLGFQVEAEGSCVLNLFDTCLADHLVSGFPTETYYPNVDGFFKNQD